MTRPLTVLVAVWLAAAGAAHAQANDSLPIRYAPVGSRLRLDFGALAAIRVDSAFSYVGGQRFILGGTADAEQHLYIVADSSRAVRRLVWIQVESRLPGIPGAYDYSTDSTVSVQGIPLAMSTRTYTASPEPSSDRARAFGLVEKAGFHIPPGAVRLRLVYLPERPARREVMIIYLESGSTTGAPHAGGSLLERASRSVGLVRSPT
jgi:hypothetical protein